MIFLEGFGLNDRPETGLGPIASGVFPHSGKGDIPAGIGGIGERAYIGGTLSANPLSCVAGYYSLLEMERTNAAVIAGQAGDRLTKGLQAIIEKYNLPFVTYNQGSIVHLETSGVMLLDLRNPIRLARELKPRKHMMEEMGAAYMSQGLVTLAGSRMYTSMADTDTIIDDAGTLLGFSRLIALNSDGSDIKPVRTGETSRSLGFVQNGGSIIDWVVPGKTGHVLVTHVYVPERSIGTRLAETRSGVGVDDLDLSRMVGSVVEQPKDFGDGAAGRLPYEQ